MVVLKQINNHESLYSVTIRKHNLTHGHLAALDEAEPTSKPQLVSPLSCVDEVFVDESLERKIRFL